MRIFILLWFISVAGFSFSQNEQVTEADIQTQSIFIEAIKSKLIERYDVAIPQFKEILKKEPANHVVWYELGFSLYKSKQIEESLDAAKKANDLNPNQTHYLELIALIYHQMQDYKSEAMIYKKLQLLNKDIESYYTNWASALRSEGNWDEVIAVMNLLEKFKGVNEISSFEKSKMYDQLGKYKEAERELVLLNETFPDEIPYLKALASFYHKADKANREIEIYKKILLIDPTDEKAGLVLASTFRQNGQDDQYLQSISAVINNSSIPLDTKIVELIPYLNKAINNQDTKLLNTLEEISQTLLKQYPEEPKTHALTADILQALGKDAKAYSEYKMAIEVGKCPKQVWNNYLNLASEFDENSIWLDHAEQAYDNFPNDPEIALIYSRALLWNHQLPFAKSNLQQLRLMIANQPSLKEKVIILEKIIAEEENDQNRMAALSRELKDLNTISSISVLWPLEYYLLQKDDLSVSNSLIAAYPKEIEKAKYGQELKAIAQFKNKKYMDAKTTFESISMNSPLFLEYYGDTLFMLKDSEAANQIWNKALDLNPSNSRLKKKVQTKTL